MPAAPTSQAPSLSNKDRQIRVFVSSTFRDMQEERDILIKKIFPQLRKMCEERAVTWTEVDLRWGITDEQQAEGKVLPLCLEEIHRCRPYFIGLLGERYGWVPDSIPAELLESQPWLKEHLQHSVTELEILHGVFSEEPMHGHAYFYFRDPRYVESVLAEKRQDFAAENAESAERLRKLKQKIRAARDEQVCGLREGYPNPEQLGEWILEDFIALINTLYPKDDVPNALDQEAARHEACAQSRRLAFVGRQDLLRKLDGHVSGDAPITSPCPPTKPGEVGRESRDEIGYNNKPLVLTGDSGCGKSALLAEWVARWRKDHPDDLIIQHYVGSTPDSADWQGVVRRILGELKRAFVIPEDIPVQPDAMRGALNVWTVKAAGSIPSPVGQERGAGRPGEGGKVILVLDALNQLADDDAARQLGWLPVVFPPNFRVLVSSLSGESLDALRKRDWPELNVPLFERADIAPAARAYFKIFSKTPPPNIVAKLESIPATCNALYLRAVLDELRQFGKHEELDAQAADYLSAMDLPELFDRILTRWHDDFGKDPEHPDLVRRSLCLIACARFGLSESELLDLLGKNGEPLPRRPWTPVYLAAENALALRSGLLNFGHHYLRAAVRKRWLEDPETVRAFRLQLEEYFAKNAEPIDRKLDELPWLLRESVAWAGLRDFLADISTLVAMRGDDRWRWELHGYWLSLKPHFDPAIVYQDALAVFIGNWHSPLEIASTTTSLGHFFSNWDWRSVEQAELMHRRALEIRERELGPEHVDTLNSVTFLAAVLEHRKNYLEAATLHRRVLESRRKVLGPVHRETLKSLNNVAVALGTTGDHAGAESMLRSALEGFELTLGPMHEETLSCVQNLASSLKHKGDPVGAEILFRRASEGFERILGPDHPHTLHSFGRLATLLANRRDFVEAESLYRRVAAGEERVLGIDHPDTLYTINHLACVLAMEGKYTEAKAFFYLALEHRERTLGRAHAATIRTLDDLGNVLYNMRDFAAAVPVYRRVWEACEQTFGPKHRNTLTSTVSLGRALAYAGEWAGAERLFTEALLTSKGVLGPDDAVTLDLADSLAAVHRQKPTLILKSMLREFFRWMRGYRER